MKDGEGLFSVASEGQTKTNVFTTKEISIMSLEELPDNYCCSSVLQKQQILHHRIPSFKQSLESHLSAVVDCLYCKGLDSMIL